MTTSINPADHEQVLVVITVAWQLEEAFVDWLLAREDTPGFTTQDVSGHASSQRDLSVAEQVRGRKRRVQFQIHLSGEASAALIDHVRARFDGADVHYWVLPLILSGRLGPDPLKP